MLVDKTIKKFSSQNPYDKRVKFPAEENALFLSTGMAAVTSAAYKPAKTEREKESFYRTELVMLMFRELIKVYTKILTSNTEELIDDKSHLELEIRGSGPV